MQLDPTLLLSQDWLVDRRKAIGRTALCLSGGGSLAMHHMGVCRFLLEVRWRREGHGDGERNKHRYIIYAYIYI